MSEDLLLLTPDAFRRMRDATLDAERGGDGRKHRAGGQVASPLTGHARVLQAGTGATYLPGKIVASRDNIIFEDFGDCWVTDLNDAFLTVRRYAVRFIGIHTDGLPIVSTDYCCGDPVDPVPTPIPPPRCYACNNPAPCLAVLVDDGFGWQGTVYIPLVSGVAGTECLYYGQVKTPNAILTISMSIGAGMFFDALLGGPGVVSQIQSQKIGGNILEGGLTVYGRGCTPIVEWDGATGQPWPGLGVGDRIGGFGYGPIFPQIIYAEAASDPTLCGGIGGAGGTGGDPGAGGGTGGVGGTTQQQCFTACSAACTDAYGAGTMGEFYCINNCAVGCFGPGGILGIRAASGGSCGGDCGCGGSCGGTAYDHSMFAPAYQFWSLVDYSNTLASATLKPLYQRTDAVGNVGVGEDTLYTNNIAANTLAINGDSVQIDITYVVAASQAGRPRLYFGGIKIYDHGTSISAGLADLAKCVRCTVTRVSSTTAIASVSPTGSDGQFVTAATLTGLNFAAAITILATGDATNNNDIKATHAVVAKLPAAETLTLAGVQTMPTVLSYGAASQCSIAQDAGGYTGASATLLHTGSASGAQDVDVYIVPSVSVGSGQIVRVFKEIGGTKVAVFQKHILPRTALATDPTWQTPEYVCTVRVNGTSEKVYISKEVNEAMLARGEPKNYFA